MRKALLLAALVLGAAPTGASAAGWLPAEALSGQSASAAASAIAPNGTPVIAWASSVSPYPVYAAVRAPGGDFTPLTVASASNSSDGVRGVAIDDAGDIAVTWYSNGGTPAVHV